VFPQAGVLQKGWVTAEALFGNGFLRRAEGRQQHKLCGGDFEIPQERNTYALGVRHEEDPNWQFPVADEVARWASNVDSETHAIQYE